jgi:hypothetical protein
MIRRIICKVLRLVRRRSTTLRTQSPLTSNSRATSPRNDPSRCRTYSGSAKRRRCALRRSSERTAFRSALIRATRRATSFRKPPATQRIGSAADLPSMTRNTQYALLDRWYSTRASTQLSDVTIHNRILSNAWERAFLKAPQTGPFFSAPYVPAGLLSVIAVTWEAQAAG